MNIQADDSEPLVVSVASATHVGNVRAANEDRLLVLEEEGIFALADGMGGHEGGAVASRVAMDVIADQMRPRTKLVDVIVRANRAVLREGRACGVPNMGTTVVLLRIRGHAFDLAWVGDSRAYRFDGGAERLTSDHSVVGQMVVAGKLEEADARKHPLRGMLTRALGGTGLDRSDIGSACGRIRPGESLMLCTDGLHGVLDDDQMHGVVRAAESVHDAVAALLQAALDAGGPDNISLVLVGFREPDC